MRKFTYYAFILVGGVVLFQSSCATLPVINGEQCGNGVLEPSLNEECDPGSPGVKNCRPAGVQNACRFDCTTSAADCPSGYSCGTDKVCRRSNGLFRTANGAVVAPIEVGSVNSTRLALADFDADGRSDVIESGNTALDVHFLDSNGNQVGEFTLPSSRGNFASGILQDSGRATLVLLDTETTGGASGGALFVYKGTGSMTLLPSLYPVFPIVTRDTTLFLGRISPSIGQIGVGSELLTLTEFGPWSRSTYAASPATHIRGEGYAFGHYNARTDGLVENNTLFPLPEFEVEATSLSYNVHDKLTPPLVVGGLISEMGGKKYPCDTAVLAINGAKELQILPLCTPASTGTGFVHNYLPEDQNHPGTNARVADPPSSRTRLKLPNSAVVGGAASILDYDEDGALDVAVAVKGGYYVALGDGAGNFRSLATGSPNNTMSALPGIDPSKSSGSSRDMVPYDLGDFNSDGLLDWVDGLGLHFNKEGLPVACQAILTAAEANYATRATSPFLGGRVMDVDGDSKLDVIAWTSDSLSIFRSSGSSPCSSRNPIPSFPMFSRSDRSTDGNISQFAVGDFDGDSINDYAYSTTQTGRNDSLYVSWGTRAFPEPARILGSIYKISQLTSGRLSWLLSAKPDSVDTITGLGFDAGGIPVAIAVQGRADRFINARLGLVSISNPIARGIGYVQTVGHFKKSGVGNGIASLAGSYESQNTADTRSKVGLRLWTVPFGGDAEVNIAEIQSNAVDLIDKADSSYPCAFEFFTKQSVRSGLVAIDLNGDGVDEIVAAVPGQDEATFSCTNASGGKILTGSNQKYHPGRLFISTMDTKVSDNGETGELSQNIIQNNPKIKVVSLDDVLAPVLAYRGSQKIQLQGADVDGDGKKDLVISYVDKTSKLPVLRVLFNDGNGQLTWSNGLSLPNLPAGADFVSAAPLWVPLKTGGIHQALAVIASDGSVYLSETDKTRAAFTQKAIFSMDRNTLGNLHSFVSGDVTGDGVEDLVVGFLNGFKIYTGTDGFK